LAGKLKVSSNDANVGYDRSSHDSNLVQYHLLPESSWLLVLYCQGAVYHICCHFIPLILNNAVFS